MLSKASQLLIAWGGALIASWLLRWAGSRSLTIPADPALVLALVFLPPLAMASWIAWRWNRWTATSDNPPD
jgi:hypothetical protein